VLESKRALLVTDSYDDLSVDAIASRAGVGKQTIYRGWGSKAAVVADAVLDGDIFLPRLWA
jgi:AcrR family transcriptional regulator